MAITSFEWHCRGRVLTPGRPVLVMGILNVTPDSFSDGGKFTTTEAAVARGEQLVAEGADLLDVGGESSRPGSQPIPLEEELSRVVPVVRELARRTSVPISVDTTKAEVARQALDAGAAIINDITALSGDSDMPAVVAPSGAGVILMHMQGTPATMQQNPTYIDVAAEVFGYLEARLHALANLGIAGDRAALDPGFGFGKARRHNLELLVRLPELGRLGRPVCLGVSRKGILGQLLNRPVEERLAGSLALAAYALGLGAAHVVRVHDVAQTRDVVTVFRVLDELQAEEGI